MGQYPDLTNPPLPTVQERCITEIINRITAMVNEDGEQLWNTVHQGDIRDIANVSLPAIALQQGTEEVVHDIWPHCEKLCAVFIEFHFQRVNGVDSYKTFRYYLGKLQARLFGIPINVNLGGLTTNVMETGSNPEMEGQRDRQPGGLLNLLMHYRHHYGDPYHLPSEPSSNAYGDLING